MEFLYTLEYEYRPLQVTVLSARFSIFVYWKVAVNRAHNLRPCTIRIYYGLYTVLYFTYTMKQARVRILQAAFLKKFVLPDFSDKWTAKFR